MRHKSLFDGFPDIKPQALHPDMSIPELIQTMGKTSFEARNVWKASRLFQKMVEENDTIWLGVAGAGVAGGMGGMIISLCEAGFIDVICSTGAQVYHDLHFAFGLPVKAIIPQMDDEELREHGDTRIYDIGIREVETLEAQDAIIRRFVKENHEVLSGSPISSWEFNYYLGQWTAQEAKYPELSFVATAARLGVPLFWDSHTNHSIAMNLVHTEKEGITPRFVPHKDVFDSAAIVYSSEKTGFVELGGGGPKNFIQQTGPTLSQILGIDFEGAERGIQIGTAVEREGSLSGCTFSEAVSWKKYRHATEENLVQIWSEYSIVFPLLAAYVIDCCPKRRPKNLISQMPSFKEKLEALR